MGKERKILIRAAAILAAALALWLAERLAPQSPGLSSGGCGSGEVARVVDGDTLRVRCGDAEEPVRLVGVDAPELARQGNPAECGAAEASAALADLVGEGPVYLAADSEQGDRDRYGRLLRFAAETPLDAGAPWEGSANLALVRSGAAGAYRGAGYAGREAFEAAEDEARAAGRGMWASCPEPTR